MDYAKGTEYNARFGPALHAKWGSHQMGSSIRSCEGWREDMPGSPLRPDSRGSSRASTSYRQTLSAGPSGRRGRSHGTRMAQQMMSPSAPQWAEHMMCPSAPHWVTQYRARPAGLTTQGMDSPHQTRQCPEDATAPFWQIAQNGGWVDGNFGKDVRFTDKNFFRTSRQSHTVGADLGLRGISACSPSRTRR